MLFCGIAKDDFANSACNSLVVAGRAREFYCRNIGIFELSVAGVPNAVLGIAYIIMLAPILLPDQDEYDRRRRLAQISPIERQAAAKKRRQSRWYYRMCFGRKSEAAERDNLVEVEDIVGDDEGERVSSKEGDSTVLNGSNKVSALDDLALSDKSSSKKDSSLSKNTEPKSDPIPEPPTSLAQETSDFILNAILLNDSPVTNLSVAEAGLRGEDGLYLISIQRGNTLYSAVGRHFGVEAGDLLSFTGRVENFVAFCARKGLQAVTLEEGEARSHDEPSVPDLISANTVRAVVRDGSQLIGKTPKEANFRRVYNAAILSIHRAGLKLKPQKMGQVQLKVGDTLILVVNEEFDWGAGDTARDLKPRMNLEQQKMIDVQDSERDSAIHSAASNLHLDRTFYIPMKVAETSKLGASIGSVAGKSIEASGVRAVPGVVLFAVQRPDPETGHTITHRAVGPDFTLQVGDVLWYSGERDGVTALRRLPGLVDTDSKQLEKLQIAAHQRRLVEVVLSLRSDMLYKTVREARFRSRFNAAIVAIHRQGAPILSTIGDVILQPGDVLILDAGPNFVSNNRDNTNFLLVAELDHSAPPRFDKFYIAFTTAVLMVTLAAGLEEKGVTLLILALWASAIMLVSGCITGDRAMKSLNWGVIITVACAFGLSTAIEKTQLAPIFGNAFVQLSVITNTGELGVLTTVLAATAVLSSLVANNAAALLMFPIAAQAAATLGVNSNRMLFALMFGASDYATPFGYQTK